MESSIFFKTKKGNYYLFDSSKSTLLNIHPVLLRIRDMDNGSYTQLKNEMDNNLKEFDDGLKKRFLKKYMLLKKNGFFSEIDVKERINGEITPEIVEKQLSSVDSVLFQVTEECNLRCRYCCYGEMYEDGGYNKSLSFEAASLILEYLVSFWASSKNLSYQHSVRIGFYGGEPLMNFKLIKQIVDKCEELSNEYNNISMHYSMTTNGLLISKYSDFLVAHQFSLLISLDGNQKHSQLRTNRKGEESFDIVFSNVKKMQHTYPEYFNEKVEFNSVLNVNSSVKEIHEFIFNEFGKIPLIEVISPTELKEDEIGLYNSIYKPYSESVEMVMARLDRSPMYKELGFFFYYQLNNSFKHYCEILYGTKKTKKKIPTGTCIPFFKKIYITSNGAILPCERVGNQNVLGLIDVKSNKVNMDFAKIAKLYNNYYAIIKEQCQDCYLVENCGQCFLQFPKRDGVPICNTKMNKEQYKDYLSYMFSLLEDNKALFEEVNKMIFS